MSVSWDLKDYKHYYSDELIINIVNKLELDSSRFKDVEEIILLAASHYFLGLEQVRFSKTPTEIKKQIKKFEKSCANLIECFEGLDIAESSDIIWSISDNKLIPDNLEQNILTYKSFKKGEFLSLLDVFKNGANLALDNYSRRQTKYSYAINAWYRIIIRLFDLSETVNCDLPHYYEDIGYISNSLDILFEIIVEIEPEATNTRIVKAMRDRDFL